MQIIRKTAYSVVSLACGLVMWQAMKNTCPPREQHLRAVTDVVERSVDRIFEDRVVFPEESKRMAEFLSSDIIPQMVTKLTQQRIDFTNYGLFSVGNIEDEDGNKFPVSLGVFGKVFTLNEDSTSNVVENIVSELDLENLIKNLNK